MKRRTLSQRPQLCKHSSDYNGPVLDGVHTFWDVQVTLTHMFFMFAKRHGNRPPLLAIEGKPPPLLCEGSSSMCRSQGSLESRPLQSWFQLFDNVPAWASMSGTGYGSSCSPLCSSLSLRNHSFSCREKQFLSSDNFATTNLCDPSNGGPFCNTQLFLRTKPAKRICQHYRSSQ